MGEAATVIKERVFCTIKKIMSTQNAESADVTEAVNNMRDTDIQIELPTGVNGVLELTSELKNSAVTPFMSDDDDLIDIRISPTNSSCDNPMQLREVFTTYVFPFYAIRDEIAPMSLIANPIERVMPNAQMRALFETAAGNINTVDDFKSSNLMRMYKIARYGAMTKLMNAAIVYVTYLLVEESKKTTKPWSIELDPLKIAMLRLELAGPDEMEDAEERVERAKRSAERAKRRKETKS